MLSNQAEIQIELMIAAFFDFENAWGEGLEFIRVGVLEIELTHHVIRAGRETGNLIAALHIGTEGAQIVDAPACIRVVRFEQHGSARYRFASRPAHYAVDTPGLIREHIFDDAVALYQKLIPSIRPTAF